MQVDMTIMRPRGIAYCHPLNHDVRLDHLPGRLMMIAAAAIDAGTLSSYADDKALWVPRTQLAAIAGFGRKLYNPADPCFVPPAALLPIVYLPDSIPAELAEQTVHQRLLLLTARRTADYLRALKEAMPPRPFDLHVHEQAATPSPLLELIRSGALRTSPSHCGWWVSSTEIATLQPAVGLSDPSSAWFVDPHDHADHDEVDRLCANHRRHWPEVYAAEPNPSMVQASL